MNPSQLGRTGEALTIDQNTNEIKGQTTGKVYGKGANLQEALALQTQIQSGGTPNVAGRPDLYATTPTAAEKPYQPIQTPAGMVKPTVATPAQLAQVSAGTLPSFNASYPKPATAPTMTTDATLGREDAKIKAMTEAAKLGAQKGLESRLNAGDSYDQQLLTQKAALLGSLFGERLTPEDLRFLSPSQQEAVRNADKSAIQAHLASLNAIAQGRKDLRAEEEAKKERETAKNLAVAKTTFQLYSDNNMWDKLDASARAKLEVSLGLPQGTVDAIAANQANDLYNYQYKDGLGNSIVELVTDKKTGKLISTRTIGSSGTGTGIGTGTSGNGFVIPQQTEKDVITFEEFLKQKEDEAQMTFGDEERKKLKSEYDALYGSESAQKTDIKDYTNQFESVVINLGSVSSQNNARKYFQELINKGDTNTMDAYLNRLAKDGLTGKAKTDFDAMGSVSSGANVGLSLVDSFATSNPGLYKTAIESAKPFFNVSKDQKWVDFTSKVQASQAGFINALYGASLTDSEQARANMFTVDFQTDNIDTVKTKLRNLRDLASEVRTRLLNEERGVFDPNSLSAKPSLDMFVTDINQFIR